METGPRFKVSSESTVKADVLKRAPIQKGYNSLQSYWLVMVVMMMVVTLMMMRMLMVMMMVTNDDDDGDDDDDDDDDDYNGDI